MRSLVLSCLWLCACAMLPVADEGYKAANSAWKQASGRPEFKAYLRAFAGSNNRQKLDTRAHCFEKSPGTMVYLVLMPIHVRLLRV
jgi:hypothetical protein